MAGLLIAFNDDWQKTAPGGIITGSQAQVRIRKQRTSSTRSGEPSPRVHFATLQPGMHTAIVRCATTRLELPRWKCTI